MRSRIKLANIMAQDLVHIVQPYPNTVWVKECLVDHYLVKNSSTMESLDQANINLIVISRFHRTKLWKRHL